MSFVMPKISKASLRRGNTVDESNSPAPRSIFSALVRKQHKRNPTRCRMIVVMLCLLI